MSKKVLSDHKRVGSKLVTPMMAAITNMQTVSWYEDILPETIWIAVINRHLGYDSGVHLFTEISKIFIDLNMFENVLDYCIMSCHDQLSQEDKNSILTSLKKNGYLNYLKECLKGFTSIYPKQPLAYIYEKSEIPKVIDQKYYLIYKNLMNQLFDKRSKESVMCAANVMYSLAANNRLVLKEGTPLSRLPEIIDYPETELSKMIAAGIRASMNAFFGMHLDGNLSDWKKYFWNQGLLLEKCEMK